MLLKVVVHRYILLPLLPSRDRQGVITACAVTLPDGRGSVVGEAEKQSRDQDKMLR